MDPQTQVRPGGQTGATTNQADGPITHDSTSAPPPSVGTIHDAVTQSWCAGYEVGKAERLDRDIEDEIQRRMHEHSLELLGMARNYAEAKGPAWTRMIEEAGA